jgi:predicted dehydrogenase
MVERPDEIGRREFVSRAALTAAGVVLGGAAAAQTGTAPAAGARVLGANDKLVLAVIGIRGQGDSLKRGFARLKNVEIKTLCDVDANLFASRVNDAKLLADVPTFKPGTEQDLRRVFDDKDIDGVIIATPNHWHALATIWAIQAGKHVYVEKPASHTVWEGRKMVEAARKYNKIVQAGTMNRSRPAVREAIEFIHSGGLGEIYMARGLCFKRRASIGRYPDGPMKPGEKYRLNAESSSDEPTYDDAYLAKVDYDIWQGPAAKKPFNRNRFHYNWHWHWDYGNADSGNQGPHQFDIARWGMNKNEHPVKITGTGGLFADPETSQETPNVQTETYEYADGKVLEFATRGTFTNDEGTQKIGNLFYGSKGWLWIDGDGRTWQSYMGRQNEKGPGREAPAAGSGSDPNVLTSIEYPHYQNWVDAIRANDRKLLTCDIEEGHLSAALAHLGNIAYRVKRGLRFDGKTERFVGDPEADKLLTRTYRAPFVIPEKV